MEIDALRYLGNTINYPLNIVNGKPTIANSKKSIEQSIISILNTEKGSRFFLPQYGSRLQQLIFESNDAVLLALLRQFIYEAIRDWEKRVKFLNVEFQQAEEVVNCTIEYRIVATSESLSFIFPFYRKIKY